MANSRGIISKLSKIVFASYNPPSIFSILVSRRNSGSKKGSLIS